MRILRNVTLVLFGALALSAATGTEVDARFDECFDISGISECVSCEGPEPVCYRNSSGCDQIGCTNESGPVPRCEGNPPTAGANVWFCVCACG